MWLLTIFLIIWIENFAVVKPFFLKFGPLNKDNMRNSKMKFANHFAKIHVTVLTHFGIKLQKLFIYAVFEFIFLISHHSLFMSDELTILLTGKLLTLTVFVIWFQNVTKPLHEFLQNGLQIPFFNSSCWVELYVQFSAKSYAPVLRLRNGLVIRKKNGSPRTAPAKSCSRLKIGHLGKKCGRIVQQKIIIFR